MGRPPRMFLILVIPLIVLVVSLFVNVNFEAKARNPKMFASGRGVRELSESNRCLKNRVVRDLSECVT